MTIRDSHGGSFVDVSGQILTSSSWCSSPYRLRFAGRMTWERNGYVFHQARQPGPGSALRRALGLWSGYPEQVRQLTGNAMQAEYSWARPGQDYLNIYEHIRHK